MALPGAVMRMKLRIFSWLAALLLLTYTANALATERTLVFAAEDSWPPFAKPDGTGLSRDIIVAALALVNTKAEFLIVPYARALKMAEQGLVDGAFNVTRQQSTTDLFEFGQEPLFQAPASFYYKAGSPLDFKSIADVPKNTVIALIIGYEYGNEYEQHRYRFNEVRVSQQRQIINLLNEGRVDVAIMFDQVAQYTLAEMGLPPDTLTKGQVNHVSDIFVAFSKQAPDIEEKISLLDEGLRALRAQQAEHSSPFIQQEH